MAVLAVLLSVSMVDGVSVGVWVFAESAPEKNMRQCCLYEWYVGTSTVLTPFLRLLLVAQPWPGDRFFMADSSSSRATPQSTMGGRGGGSLSPAPGGKGGSSSSSLTTTATGGASAPPLAATYPVNTLMELKLSPFGNTVRGLVYCTDDFSNSIVLKKALPHTTVSSEVTIVNASSVISQKAIEYEKKSGGGGDDGGMTEDDARKLAGVDDLDELKIPLPNVGKKILEERERRAIRLAEESFRHINQKVSLFDATCMIFLMPTSVLAHKIWGHRIVYASFPEMRIDVRVSFDIPH